VKQQNFEARFARQWEEFEQKLRELEESRAGVELRAGKDKSHAGPLHDFPRWYRQICHLHAMAIERHYSSTLIQRLEGLVTRGYQVLYRPRPSTMREFIRFVVVGFPATVRAEWRMVALATALFLGPALVCLVTVLVDPAFIYAVLPVDAVDNIEGMYRIDNERFGEQRESSTDLAMFGHYIRNNIGIAFQCFATGLLWGLGSMFYLLFNGLVLGGISGHIVNLDYSVTFFSFVISHGSFELTAIVLSGAAGLKLGLSLLFPGRRRRLDALRQACVPAARIVGGVALMLLIAAFIEAYWSSSSNVGSTLKFIVGSGLWLLVFVYLLGSGRSHAAR
jgi:uncharacterized membrane protein SpoIIM required for sporulation